MDTEFLDTLEECLSVDNDVIALEYYLINPKRIFDTEDVFYCDGAALIDIVNNIMPLHYEPLEEDIIGTIRIDKGETIEDVNMRNIKYVICGFEATIEPLSDNETADLDYEIYGRRPHLNVAIPKYTKCYRYNNVDTGFVHVFTKQQLMTIDV